MIGEEGKRHYIFIKDFNTFIYHDTLQGGGKHFCCYCLKAFSTEELLKRYIKDWFKLMVNKGLGCAQDRWIC